MAVSKALETQAPDELNASLVLDALTGAIDASKIVFSVGNSEEAAKRIAQKDANAKSLDELLGSSELINGKDYTNKPFQLLSVEWQQSTFVGSGGAPFYAVLHGRTPQGASVVIGCGATAVMRKAAKMVVEGWLPCWIKITAGKPTETGNIPLDIADASEFAPFDGGAA